MNKRLQQHINAAKTYKQIPLSVCTRIEADHDLPDIDALSDAQEKSARQIRALLIINGIDPNHIPNTAPDIFGLFHAAQQKSNLVTKHTIIE